MKKLLLALCLLSATAHAQNFNQPLKVLTTQTGGTIAVTNTWQIAIPLGTSAAGVAGRNGCTIQNTSTSNEYVYFDRTGTTAPTGLTAAYTLATGASLNCMVSASLVAADAVWITGTAGATFVTGVQ